MMETANRDMHNWWAEYDILMANYRAMFADNVCHNPDMLNASLLIIEAKIEKVAMTNLHMYVVRQQQSNSGKTTKREREKKSTTPGNLRSMECFFEALHM